MAGRIHEDDIAMVRERARIDEVVSAHVTLRRAGGGSLKGLCPFHDEKTPSFHVTPARNFFHCLAGETEVLTWDGVRPIRELAGGTHRVLNSRANWVEAPFYSFGAQPLTKITLTRNRQVKQIYATSDHRWFVQSGKDRSRRREVVTKELRPGHTLSYVYPHRLISRTTPSPFGIAHGFTFGDGTHNGNGSMALLCPPKDTAMLKWFPNSHVTASGDNFLVHHLPRFFKSFPDLDESCSYLLGWLAGYFAADGCVAADGTVMLNSALRENLEFVRAVCTRLGIGTYGITEQRREGFAGREPSSLFRTHLVNNDLAERFFLLDEHRRRFVAAEKKYARRGWVVRSVEPTDRVEEVYCAVVDGTHDFVLADNILTGNCFGCEEGGDVFDFVMKVEGLTFTDAVERLAGRYGVQLRYTEPERAGGGPRRDPAQRPRLLQAHRLAAQFYADQLRESPEARVGRQFLADRGFDQQAAEQFGVGFAPRGGDVLYRHLRQQGFGEDELVTGGLVGRSGRGPYDRFRGRLLWPIRETNGDVVGFGARRMFDDDGIEAKYLNTPETPIFKKSHLLYGVDLARREIARRKQAVVVEGYTDVMACHLSGVGTAVATCGTAFGEDHGRVLRRLLLDHEQFRGEIIFTFDGDEAGQRAALRAFEGDQQFVAQTYVAVDPDGLDPCDLRLQQGDAAVRELVARRMPLYRFVLRNVLAGYDLDRADARVDAVREAAGLVASVRDRSKIDAFARELAGMVGADVDEVRAEVRRAAGRGRRTRPGQRTAVPTGDGGAHGTTGARPAKPAEPERPPLGDPGYAAEREALQVVVQYPALAVGHFAELDDDDFTHPTLAGVRRAVEAVGGPEAASGGDWVSRLRDKAEDEHVQSALSALAVAPLRVRGEPDARVAAAWLSRPQELTLLRRIEQLKSRLQRTNPVEEQADYNRMFGQLMALEQRCRDVRERIIGGSA